MLQKAWPLIGAASFALFGCMTHFPTLRERLDNSERRAAEAERLLDQAEREMQALEPDQADSTLKQAQTAVSDPDFGYYPERQQIAQRLAADVKRLPKVRKDREARELAIAVGKRRAVVEKAVAELEPAMAALKSHQLVSADLDRVNHSANALQDALKDGSELEIKDAGYDAYAKRQHRLLEQSRLEIELGRARLEFVRGPAKTRQKALDVSRRATLETDRSKQSKLRTKARQIFAECANEGQKMLLHLPRLAGAVTKMGDEELSPQQVVNGCARLAQPPRAAPPKLAHTTKRKRHR